jgi:alkylation response protein AidB-like acyl-CoA dehydrogenase
MDFELSEEQKALIAMGRDFCKREVKPGLTEELLARDRTERMPWDLVKKMHDIGLTTLTVPRKYGGGEADLLTRVVLAYVLGQYPPLVGTILAPIWKYCDDLAAVGSEEQQDEIFSRVMDDHTFTMGESGTEPEHGHDIVLPYDEPGSGLKTFAYRDGDEYVINGEKCFCGGASASLLFVYLRTDKQKPLSQSMSLILVPRDTPGFSIQRINEFMHERVRPNGDLLFDNARVPARYLVGEENKGFDIFNGRRAFLLPRVAFDIGGAQAIYEFTREFAKTRVQGGRPIIKHPTVGTRIVDMHARIEQARLLVYQTAWEYDRTGSKLVSPFNFELCNATSHDLQLLVATHAAEVFGGRVALKEMPVAGYVHNALGFLHTFGTATMNRIKAMDMI